MVLCHDNWTVTKTASAIRLWRFWTSAVGAEHGSSGVVENVEFKLSVHQVIPIEGPSWTNKYNEATYKSS